MRAARPSASGIRLRAAGALGAAFRGLAILGLVVGAAAAISYPLWSLATRRRAEFTRGVGLLMLAAGILLLARRLRRGRGSARGPR